MLTRRQFCKWTLLTVGSSVWHKNTLAGAKNTLGINKMIKQTMDEITKYIKNFHQAFSTGLLSRINGQFHMVL